MNTTPTKLPRRRGQRQRHVENRPPNDAAIIDAVDLVDLTGASSSDEADNESHLKDRKPKAKNKKEYQKTDTATTDTADDDDSVIDLTTPPSKPPPPTARYDSGDDTDDDDDEVVCVVHSPSLASTMAGTTATFPLAERNSLHHSSLQQRRRRESLDDSASLALARQLQEQDGMAMQQQRREQKTRDEQEAWRLQKEFDKQDQKQKRLLVAKRRQDEEQMIASVTGRAWQFVEKVLALDASLKQKHKTTTSTTAAEAAATVNASNQVSAIAKDDMVFLCEQMLRQQEAFRSAGKPIKVDLGFHYTRPANLSRIRTDGLLSKAEREGRNITSAHHGSAYGDGIYTSDDHSVGGYSGGYGDIGIIVARLKGTEKHAHSFSGSDHDCNQSRSHAITVLKTSAQCLALVEFHRSVLFPTTTTAVAAAPTRVPTAAAAAPHLHAAMLGPQSAALQALLASQSAALQALLASQATAAHLTALAAYQAASASASAALPLGALLTPPSMTVPAVNSGIIGEYHWELQKIVDETFNSNK